MLAEREGVLPCDAEIRRRAEVLAIDEDTRTPGVDLCFQVPNALPEGHWRKT